MKEYHLYKNDYAKLQLTINDTQSYCNTNREHCFTPHRHSYFQIIWFKEKGIHHVDYQTYEHPENAIFLIGEGQVHHFCDNSENKGYLYHFNEFFLQGSPDLINSQIQLFNPFKTPFYQLTDPLLDKLESLTENILAETKGREVNYREIVYHQFQLFLLLLIRLINQKDEVKIPSIEQTLARQFLKLVEGRNVKLKTVAHYSRALGVSEKTLTSAVKNVFQNTPAKIMVKKKVLEAKRLLTNTPLSIKEVAFALGFEQPTYFTKYFKKHTSLTPKAFQASFR